MEGVSYGYKEKQKTFEMKIFYLVQMLSPYRVDWMNEFSKEHQVTVYYMYDKEKTRTSEWLDSRGKTFDTKKLSCFKMLNAYFSLELKKILKREVFDVYIIDGYSSPVELSAIKYLTKKKKNVFINVDGIDVWRHTRFVDKIKLYLKKKVYRMPVSFLCGSKIAADYIVRHGGSANRVFKHNFSSIRSDDIVSFALKKERQTELKKRFKAEGKLIAVAAGRFIPLKRYEDLLYAWKNAPPNCELFLIGGGELKASYIDIVQREGVKNVHIIDFVLSDELYDYFLAADLFIHTTSTDTWGLVINEAMAKGCPIISSNRCVAGVELIKDGENGFLYNVGDVCDLGTKIEKVLSDGTLRENMMKKVLSDIKDYTVENMVKMQTDFINKTTFRIK